MLSEAQQKRVWEGMLESEFRALYFSDLSASSLTTDKWIGFATLFSSAGCIASAVGRLPELYAWVPVVLSIVVGVLGILRVSLQFYKRSVDCSELALKWQKVARDYERLWENIYRNDAEDILERVDLQADELAKPGIATGKPNQKRLEHWWNYVIEQRTAHV